MQEEQPFLSKNGNTPDSRDRFEGLARNAAHLCCRVGIALLDGFRLRLIHRSGNSSGDNDGCQYRAEPPRQSKEDEHSSASL